MIFNGPTDPPPDLEHDFSALLTSAQPFRDGEGSYQSGIYNSSQGVAQYYQQPSSTSAKHGLMENKHLSVNLENVGGLGFKGVSPAGKSLCSVSFVLACVLVRRLVAQWNSKPTPGTHLFLLKCMKCCSPLPPKPPIQLELDESVYMTTTQRRLCRLQLQRKLKSNTTN